jgi:integrase
VGQVIQMLDSEQKELLENGKLLLYTRNGIYYARVYVGNRKYIHRTLKTSKASEARKLGLRYLHEVEFKQAEALPLQQLSFNEVIKEYVALREREYDRSKQDKVNTSTQQRTSIFMLRQIKRVVKFWQEYCGKVAVDKIDNGLLQDYVQWRKDYYHKLPKDKLPKNARINPADKTIEWEMILAKTLLKFATDRGYRGNKPLPTYRFKAEKTITRPALTLPEYHTLIKRMREWIRETDNEEWKYTREMMRDYVLILANTGMRVGELNNLKVSDIVEFKDGVGRKNYMFNVKGKTGKREVVGRVSCVRYVDRTKERNEKWREEWARIANERDQMKAEGKKDRSVTARKEGSVRSATIKINDGGGEYLFRMRDGSPIITLIDQFDKLLKSVNLLTNRHGEKYTLYSLRHFYAVQMLRRGRAGVFDIARNMGTSVQIVEQYYARSATSLELASKLGGGGVAK